jgi:NADPH2:quinone reductase
MKAIVMRMSGGLDVLSQEDLPEAVAGPKQVLVEVAAAGVNFMDVGVRQGLYWTDMLNPKVIGVEGAGRVIAAGADVEEFVPGQRVAWAYAPGSYAERIAVPADALVHVPDAIDDHTAAAVMMQGLTASHFATDFYPVRPGEIALVHAAAGGVGQLLTQLVKLRGGTVIGRVSHANKTAAARAAGADHVIVDADGQFAGEVLRLTDGEGVHVVYDGSGAATFDGSIASLRRSGTLCWYGPGLGLPAPLDLYRLPRSVKLGYAAFYDHVPTPALLRARAGQLFDWIVAGKLRVTVGGAYPLADAALAHAALESRGTTGKLLLIP